jgi:hypothetical protein
MNHIHEHLGRTPVVLEAEDTISELHGLSLGPSIAGDYCMYSR